MEKKRFCAHRGVSALMPENTLPAFGAALALGADEIEFDIRLTKDGKLVVMGLKAGQTAASVTGTGRTDRFVITVRETANGNGWL